MEQNEVIYLDNNATTKLDPRVLEAMMPYLTDQFANASSSHHFGLRISKAIDDARMKVANLIGANESEIVFTSGATESINLALKGFALANQGKGKHLITVVTEHKAVLDTCKYLESIGFEITYLPVSKEGLIQLDGFQNQLRKETILVCVMHSNNEIGVIQPIHEIANLCRQTNVAFLTDATQTVGKIKIDVAKLGLDFMAFSAHKFYGPKGIGCLYIKDLKRKNLRIDAMQHGGGHENGHRSGTLNVPSIVGLAKACELAEAEMDSDAKRILRLRNELEERLVKNSNAYINGSKSNRMYNVSNISFPGTDANALIGKLRNVAVSNGSACTSAIMEPSHVLRALGLSDDEAMSSIRFSLGKYNTTEEIEIACDLINEQTLSDSTVSPRGGSKN